MSRDRQDNKTSGVAIGSVICVVIIAAIIGSAILFPGWWLPPVEPPEPFKGPIYPQVEMAAGDDSTDPDATGTYEFWNADNNPSLIEPTLTWGTDTKSTAAFASEQSFWFVCKSTVANVADHFSWLVTLPDAGYTTAEGPNWKAIWHSGDESWGLTLYIGQEATPTLKCYDDLGEEVGSTAYDLSDHGYSLTFELQLAIQSNYDGLYWFYDPDEQTWDNLYLIMTHNITNFYAGWELPSPWKVCDDGASYYINLNDFILNGMIVRWDEQDHTGLVKIPITFMSHDIDLEGTGAVQFTFNMQECQDDENAYKQQWETDSLTNLAGSVTAETLDIQD